MCPGNGTSTQSTNSNSWNGTLYNPWVANAGGQLYGNASASVAANPYQKYTGPTTAAVTQPQQAATGQLEANAASPNVNTVAGAGDAASVAGAINPNETIQSLINPYVSATLAPTLQNLALAEGQTQQQTDANAALAGAYGGSAQGVGNAVNQKFYGQNVAGATAQAYDNAYQNAEQQRTTDLGTLLNAGTTQANIGAGQQGSSTQAAAAAGALGQGEQSIGQTGINTAINANNSNQFGQLQQYASLASLLGAIPKDTNTVGGQTNTTTGPNNAGTALLTSLLGSGVQGGGTVGGNLLGGLVNWGSSAIGAAA